MKRIKINGKAASKFDIAYCLEFDFNFRSLPWCHMVDAFSYAEMVLFYNEAIKML